MTYRPFVHGPPSAGVRDGHDVIDAFRWAADQIESTSAVRTLDDMTEDEKAALETLYGCRVSGRHNPLPNR